MVPSNGRVIRNVFLRLAAGILTIICLTMASPTSGQEVNTLRYDLPGLDLGTVGNELTLDYAFPPVAADIVSTRFSLTFESDALAGFDAARIGLILQPPIDDPASDDDRVLTLVRSGSDFGWSGTGTFVFQGETNELNGRVLDAPPGSSALLYGITLFNSARLTDPNDFSPIGGRFVASHIELDYVAIPEPRSQQLVMVALLASLLAARPRPS
jgi:hypothetical protein